MMRRDFQNPSIQREKAEVLNNERKLRGGDRAGTTHHALAGIDQALEGGGRFKSEVIITGAASSIDYPAAASPWSGPQPPPEEPLGIAIDAAPVVGEAHEVARSIEALAVAPTFVTAGEDAEPVAPTVASPVVETGSAILPEAEQRLKALLDRGLVKRRKLA